MNRLNSDKIMVINHYAQNFPDLFEENGNLLQFDRIVCDVPCSSDAAIRKIPQKWDKWTPHDGMALHPLQLKILLRGIQLIKVGGKISYSTCSLSPIEDEAVVAAALKTYPGCLQIEKVQVPGFRFRDGLTDWKVLSFKPKSAP